MPTFASALAVAIPAFADQSPPPAAPAPVAAPQQVTAPKPKQICRSEALIGSIARHHICHTAAEWAEIDGVKGDNAQQMLDDAERSKRGGR